MADEHNGWLDAAAADRLLRGEPADPAGPGADPRARAGEARLRAALESLNVTPLPGRELPGEKAALAAFRAARATAPAPRRPTAVTAASAAHEPAAHEPLVSLTPVPTVRIPAQRRTSTPVRFGLAAALAGVAVGGIAAVASSGLLDREAGHTAAPAPAVSVSADTDSPAGGESGGPAPLIPRPDPSTPQRGDGFVTSPGTSRMPGTDSRTTPGTTSGSGSGSHFPTGGAGTGMSTSTGSGTNETGDGGRELFTDRTDKADGSGGGSGKDRDRDKQARAADLCEDYRAGRMNDDRRSRLSKLAGALAKIPRYCEFVLDGPRDGLPQSGSDGPGGEVLKVPAPTPTPGVSLGSRHRR
ncbi:MULTISPECIES: hypothetical protein [unclassified Streptomyces]|uniref:hypothetical protein n=1 Tax=unclassified Streptomyces TaxID=2593676 RepID=UPI0036482590